MAFTDDDLKRLKEEVRKRVYPEEFSFDLISPLISRLEAAEKVVQEIDDHFMSDQDYVGKLIDTWREVAGK